MMLAPRISASLTKVLSLITFSMLPAGVLAAEVELQNGTATFSQGVYGGGPYSPQMAIDGIFYTGTPCCSNGWTIDRMPGDFTTSEIAVWQTTSDVGPSFLTMTMFFLDPNPGHLLGRFRWSVTTDDRTTYADGLSNGGDVDANWTVLKNPLLQIPTGMTYTSLPDDSVLLGGAVPQQGLYQVGYQADLAGITGIRLEVLKDPSLPGDGPGFYPNGNFVLTELQLNAVPIPEPAKYVLMLVALVLVGIVANRRHQ
jgi:hypothetical protein